MMAQHQIPRGSAAIEGHGTRCHTLSFLPTRVVALGLLVCTCDENPYKALILRSQTPLARHHLCLLHSTTVPSIAVTRCDHVLHRAATVPLR